MMSNGRPLEMQTLTWATEEPQHNPAEIMQGELKSEKRLTEQNAESNSCLKRLAAK